MAPKQTTKAPQAGSGGAPALPSKQRKPDESHQNKPETKAASVRPNTIGTNIPDVLLLPPFGSPTEGSLIVSFESLLFCGYGERTALDIPMASIAKVSWGTYGDSDSYTCVVPVTGKGDPVYFAFSDDKDCQFAERVSRCINKLCDARVDLESLADP